MKDYKKKVNGMIVDMYPPQFIALQEELLQHPATFSEKIVEGTNGELELILANLAAELNILCDGYYTRADLAKLADACIMRLRARRKAVIVPPSIFSS